MSLDGGGTLAYLIAALFALTSLFDKQVGRDILIAALGRELAGKAIVVKLKYFMKKA
jgi:hypothetical protein